MAAEAWSWQQQPFVTCLLISMAGISPKTDIIVKRRCLSVPYHWVNKLKPRGIPQQGFYTWACILDFPLRSSVVSCGLALIRALSSQEQNPVSSKCNSSCLDLQILPGKCFQCPFLRPHLASFWRQHQAKHLQLFDKEPFISCCWWNSFSKGSLLLQPHGIQSCCKLWFLTFWELYQNGEGQWSWSLTSQLLSSWICGPAWVQ